MRNLPLEKVYQKLEPGPVVLLTTAYAGKANVMTMSWRMMVDFTPPLIAECGVDIECRVVDRKMASRYNMFILEAVKARLQPGMAEARTLHHCGFGKFVLDGEIVQLRSAKP